MRFLGFVFSFGLTALPAQQILQNFSSLDYFRWYSPMGDVNGDGYEDMLTTSAINVSVWPYYNPNQNDYELRLYSGRDGTLLRLGPRWAYPDGANSIPTGDHDHDGVRDYICLDTDFTSPTPTRRLSVRSGRDDHVMWMRQSSPTTYWIYHVIGDLDVNGDGELDVVVSHPGASSGYGAYWAYDHQGNLLYSVLGTPNPNYTLAQSLAKLGDVNGDGCDDYLMGLGDPTWRGAVAVISGINGQFLRIVWGQNVGDYIGSGCTGCGDLDGDGLPDFAAGGGLSGSNGSVQAFSSATGARLFAYYSGTISDGFGSVLRAADYDHDGIDDIIAATWAGVRVISGRDGTQIARYIPNSTASVGTFEAQPLRTPSGFPHLFVRTQVLGAFLMSAAPQGSRSLGLGCAIGSAVHVAPRLGMRELTGFDRRLTLSGAEPGSMAFLLLGLASPTHTPLNLAPLGLPKCSVYPDIQIVAGFPTGTNGIQAGFARHDFAIPSASAFGRGIDAQWVTLDANFAPAGLSEALRFAIHN